MPATATTVALIGNSCSLADPKAGGERYRESQPVKLATPVGCHTAPDTLHPYRRLTKAEQADLQSVGALSEIRGFKLLPRDLDGRPCRNFGNAATRSARQRRVCPGAVGGPAGPESSARLSNSPGLRRMSTAGTADPPPPRGDLLP